MTVLTEHNRLIHTADGVATVYAYDFYVPDLTYLFVFWDDIQQLSGWTADGEGSPTGGNITYDVAPPADTVITHIRYLPVTQLIDWRPYDPFNAEVNEDAMDKVTMICQQITDEAQRAINLPLSSDGLTSIIFPSYEEILAIGWDETERKLTDVEFCSCPPPYVDQKRRLFGQINGVDGALIKGNSGFTTGRDSIGQYIVSFTNPISTPYVVVVSKVASGGNILFSLSETSAGFSVHCRDAEDADYQDSSWSFILRYGGCSVIEIPVPNGGFETGDLSNWNVYRGSTDAAESASDDGSSAVVYPYEGNFMVAAQSPGNSWYMRSDKIDLIAAGADAAKIDAGEAFIAVRAHQIAYSSETTTILGGGSQRANDRGRIGMRFYAADGTTEVGSDVRRGWGGYSFPHVWTERAHRKSVPATTRYVELLLNSKSDVGSYPSAFFDNVRLLFTDCGPEPSPNLIVNGTFEGNASGWNLTGGSIGGVARYDAAYGGSLFVRAGQGSSYGSQEILTIGKNYYMEADVYPSPAGSGARMQLGTGGGSAINVSAGGHFSFTVNNVGSSFAFCSVQSYGGEAYFDNVIVREVLP